MKSARESGRRKITGWISGFSIRCSRDADDSFSGDCGGRAGPQRRDRESRAPERIARGRFRCHKRRERGGRAGITPKITIDLLRAGASVITTGDHIWDQKEIFFVH